MRGARQPVRVALSLMALPLVVSAAGVGTASAQAREAANGSAGGRGRLTLDLDRYNDCETGQPLEGPYVATRNFAHVRRTGNTLVTTVMLRDAEPKHTYGVYVTQLPGGVGCNVEDGELTTNRFGRSVFRLTEPLARSTRAAFVLVYDGSAPWYQSGPAVVRTPTGNGPGSHRAAPLTSPTSP